MKNRLNNYIIVILMQLLFQIGLLFAGDYYVATTGSDSAVGSFDQPWATIQYAFGQAVAGDTVYILGGRYHESIAADGLKGTADKPITFTNYQNDVVTIDGMKSLVELGVTSWTQHSGSIWKTTINEDVWQMFVDGEMMIMARWPNLPAGMSLWDQDQELSWAHGNESQSVANTVEVDDANSGEDLAASGLDMTGAMAILNIGSFKTWPRLVTSHTAGSGSFTYNDIPLNGYRDKHHYYYMECKLDLLDAENEWFYDTNGKTLYLWVPGGGLPVGDVRGKTVTYAMDITNSNYVVIDGLDFFGATFSFDNSSNCTVKNCDLQFPSCSKRMLGIESNIQYTRMYASSNGAAGNTVYNCVFEKTDGMALGMKGDGAVIDNNYFHNIDYTCAGLPGLGVSLRIDGGSNAIFRRNTIVNTGTSSAISPSMKATNEYNRITNTGMLQSDGACIHYMVGPSKDSITRYNWIHDTPKYTIRFDNSIGELGLVHHNMVWNAGCMRLKGDWHQTYSNSGFGYINWKGNINIASEGGNANSITQNNAASLITMDPILGTASNNYNCNVEALTMRQLLRDIDNYDFRPRVGTPLVDMGFEVAGITDGHIGTAPDIGAYEHGDANYWIAGRKLGKASTAIPPDGAINVKLDADLMWLEGLDAMSHNVYFGIESGNLSSLGNKSNNIVDPSVISSGQTYYWRVDAVTDSGIITGDEWSFTTVPAIGRTRQVSVTAVEDAFVDVNTPDGNFGDSSIIDLKTPSAGNILKQGYIKFDIPDFAGTITSAVLQLYTSRGSPLQGGADVFGVSDNSWSEDTITWNNQPGIDGAFIDYGYVASQSWGDFDVSSYITGNGIYSLGLIRGVSVSNRSVDSTETDHPPKVVLTYEVFQLGPDIDGNGDVDLIDYAIFAGQWSNGCNESGWCDGADLNLSGEVDLDDLQSFVQSWLE